MIEISSDIIQKILSLPLKTGINFAEIFCEKSKTTSISLEDNKIEKVRSGIDLGTGIRLIHQNISYYGYINSLDENDLLKLAKEITLAVKTSNKPKKIKLLSAKKANYYPIYKKLPENSDLKQKSSYVLEANSIARNYHKYITQVSASYADTTQDVLIANSLGVCAQEQRVRTRFVVQAVAQKNNIIETGYESAAGAQGLELLEKNPPKAIALAAAQRAILCLEAAPAPAGKLPVVLAGEAGGTMVHEACGHALEADFIHKQTSIFKDKIGKSVVSKLITVIDDGSLPGNYGSSSFDDEGTPTKKNTLIEQGRLTGFMSDYLNAKFLKLPPSGNGRRQSYRYTPIPRMTNTYIQAGNSNYAQILNSVDKGVLVKKMGGGQVDITNGNFVFEISEGYLIKNGKQDIPIRGATLVGNGIEVLSTVDMIGNDLYFIPGTCGKGQHAPVSDGQPTLRIPELIIGGHS